MIKKFVVQVKDVTAIQCWQDDVLPGVAYEFDSLFEAKEALKGRKKLSRDFDFRVIARDEDENEDVLYTSA